MAIQCPNCKKHYDVTLFAFGRKIECSCGAWVDGLKAQRSEAEGSKGDALFAGHCIQSREGMSRIQRDADRICQMILNEEIQWIDIHIAIEGLRERVEKLFPDSLDLFAMIYRSRFQRLREQFRKGSDHSAP